MWTILHLEHTTLLVSNMFGGTIPQGKTLLVACDAKYYVEHFVPLAYSAVGAGEQIHAHVVNPDRGCHGLSMVLEEDIGVTYSFERTDLSGIDSRTYYACARFMILPELMAHGLNEALVLDTDCLVMNEIDWSQFRDADVGLFFREPLANTGEWETQGSKIAQVQFTSTRVHESLHKMYANVSQKDRFSGLSINEDSTKHMKSTKTN